MLAHFSRSICSQPLRVAHDHRKWLHMDLFRLFKMLVDLELFTNVFANVPNVKLILERSSLIFFLSEYACLLQFVLY